MPISAEQVQRERAEADAAMSQGFSAALRKAAGREGGSTSPTPSTSPLAQALAALDSAQASGDEIEIARADAALDSAVEAARERAKGTAPDFGAGARRPAPAEESFSDRLRREHRDGW